MRRIIYQALLRVPFRVGGFVFGALGFIGSVWPDKIRTLLNGGAFPIQTVSAILFAIAVIYFVLLWWLKPGERDGGAGISPTTHGPYSPAIGAARDAHVTIHQHTAPAPAVQERKQHRDYRGWNERSLDGLERVMRGAGTPSDPAIHAPKPDMELREVIDRLADYLDGPVELITDFERRLEHKIKDGVRHWRLHTWGRKNDPDAGLDAVWGDAWLKGRLNPSKGWLRFKHPDNPHFVHSWTDLHFNRDEVDQWIPPKSGSSWITGY